MKIRQVAVALQRLYESGLLSYPRTQSRILTPQSARRLTGHVPDTPVVGQVRGHEALNPRGAYEACLSQNHVADRPLAMLQRIARHTRACLEPVLSDRPDVQQLPAWARNLPWRRARDTMDFVDFLAVKAAGVSMRPDSPDVRLLNRMAQQGLGRPSTWIRHIKTLFDRRLIDARLQLTPKGNRWLASVPEAMARPEIAREIESRLHSPGSVPKRVSAALAVLPDSVAARINNHIGRTNPPKMYIKSQ